MLINVATQTGLKFAHSSELMKGDVVLKGLSSSWGEGWSSNRVLYMIVFYVSGCCRDSTEYMSGRRVPKPITESHRLRLRGTQPHIRWRTVYMSGSDGSLGSWELPGSRPMKSPHFLPKRCEVLMVIEVVFIYTAQSPQIKHMLRSGDWWCTT